MSEPASLPLADLARLLFAQVADPASGYPADMAPHNALELIACALETISPVSEREERAALDLARGFRAWSEALAEDAASVNAANEASAHLAAQGVLTDPTLGAKPICPAVELRDLRDFRVTWEIDLAACSPRDAAEKALAIHRDPASSAVHFTVVDDAGVLHAVDLLDDADGEGCHVETPDETERCT